MEVLTTPREPPQRTVCSGYLPVVHLPAPERPVTRLPGGADPHGDVEFSGVWANAPSSGPIPDPTGVTPHSYDGDVTTFLVARAWAGLAWDRSRAMEEQSGWAAHAAFMNELVDAGFIVLGGPVANGHRAVLVIEAESEEVVRATLARDPWTGSHLVDTIDRWTILLDGRPR